MAGGGSGKERTPPTKDDKEESPAPKEEPQAEVIYVEAPLPKVNPWKKPEQPVVIAPPAPAEENPVTAVEKIAVKPVKKVEKKPRNNSDGKARRESGGVPAEVSRQEETEAAPTEAEVGQPKKPEVRTLPPAPKNNPWKKSVVVREKEEAEQPKVILLFSYQNRTRG